MFALTASQVTELPVDEVALAILHDAVESNTWNSGNWLLEHLMGSNSDANHALSEAWGWLFATGLMAKNLESNHDHGAVLVTRLGRRTAEAGLSEVRAIQRLGVDLHPTIEIEARSQFLMGRYDLAAFAAMKAVEVRVRELIEASDSLLGVKLMRSAFADGGRLRDPDLDPGEQVARMEVFAGAIGLFKNPTSHRDVQFDDATEAAEVVLLADLLMRMLDRMQVRGG
jgi:uncharacterized protein (TIGR02391 family)